MALFRAKPAARPWLGRVALIFASTVLSLALAELTVRLVGATPERYAHPWHVESADKHVGLDLYPDNPRGDFPIDLRDTSVRERLRGRGVREIDQRYERTPFAVPFEYSVELCRGGPMGPKTRPRVVVIGDSFTEGQGVREQDTFVARLRALVPSAELLNCGRRGYDFPELARWFDRKLALDPDVIVYSMVLNDPEQSAQFHARQAYLDDWILARRRMFTEDDRALSPWQSRLLVLVQDRLAAARVGAETTRWYQDMVGPANQDGWDRTLAHLERMNATMRARGGAFLVVLWPLMVDLDDGYPFESTHTAITRALESRHIAVHDALPAFRGRDPGALWVHPADRHPNEAAHAIFADEMAPAVRAAIGNRR